MKKIKIYQTRNCISNKNQANQMILMFTENKKHILTIIVEIPSWFEYYNCNYVYYPPCLN